MVTPFSVLCLRFLHNCVRALVHPSAMASPPGLEGPAMGEPGSGTDVPGSQHHGSGGDGVASGSSHDSALQNLPQQQALGSMLVRLEASQAAASALAASNQSKLYEQMRTLTTSVSSLAGRIAPLEGLLYGQEISSTPAPAATSASYDELLLSASGSAATPFGSPPPRGRGGPRGLPPEQRRTSFRQFEDFHKSAAHAAALLADQEATLQKEQHAQTAQEAAHPTSSRFGKWAETNGARQRHSMRSLRLVRETTRATSSQNRALTTGSPSLHSPWQTARW